ncbi:hypothetical protein AAG906_032865 [Vitis piasezkii]
MIPLSTNALMYTSHEGISNDGKQIGKYCKKLSNEIGLIMRQCAPVIVEKWKQMPRFDINIMLDLIKVKLL